MPDAARLAVLLVAVARRDEAAFAELYRLAAPLLLGRIRMLVREGPLAEDVLQDTFVAVWRHAASFDPKLGSAMAWLTTVARNRAFRVIRARGPSVGLDEEEEVRRLPSTEPSPLDTTMAGDDARLLQRCLETLEGPARQALMLAFWGGHSYAGVAGLMSAPEGTVKSWIRRGLVRLKDCIGS